MLSPCKSAAARPFVQTMPKKSGGIACAEMMRATAFFEMPKEQKFILGTATEDFVSFQQKSACDIVKKTKAFFSKFDT